VMAAGPAGGQAVRCQRVPCARRSARKTWSSSLALWPSPSAIMPAGGAGARPSSSSRTLHAAPGSLGVARARPRTNGVFVASPLLRTPVTEARHGVPLKTGLLLLIGSPLCLRRVVLPPPARGEGAPSERRGRWASRPLTTPPSSGRTRMPTRHKSSSMYLAFMQWSGQMITAA
jgi:hypothetical protein